MKKLAILLAAAALPLTATVPAYAQKAKGPELSKTDKKAESSSDKLSVTLPEGLKKSMFGKRDLQVLAVQVMLDRSNHSPGVIDGYSGGNTERAVAAYRKARGLDGSGIDGTLLRSLLETQSGDIFQTYTITESDVSQKFYDIPDDFAKKAELDRLGYKDAKEMLAERFHMDQKFFSAINPGADFMKAGTKIHVISKDDGKVSGDIAKIEVRKSEGSVVALDADGKMIASYPATIGSSEFPSPSGDMTVAAVAPEAAYYFNPDNQEWGPDKQFKIAAGPNNPVGGVWIDLSKDGYGIHGSPEPQWIGKTNSHGCVRLTNWDARELADAVTQGVEVVFM